MSSLSGGCLRDAARLLPQCLPERGTILAYHLGIITLLPFQLVPQTMWSSSISASDSGEGLGSEFRVGGASLTGLRETGLGPGGGPPPPSVAGVSSFRGGSPPVVLEVL